MDELKKYSPSYQHINDSLAFVVHLSFLSQKCKLVGLSEEQYLDDIGSIPQGWNKSNEIYQFRYIKKGDDKDKDKDKDEEEKKDENKNTILVKILSMGDNELLITAVKQGSNDVSTLEITLSDHIDIDKAKKDLSDYQSIYKDINGLKVLLNDQITFKAIPQKKAKEQAKDDKDKNKNKNNDNDVNPLIFPDPANPNPNPLFIGGGRPGGGIPFGGGFGGDMDPFGGGGGNLMGPDQINQQWNRRGRGGNNGNRGGGLPGVPPNARFDPFGPGGQEPDPDHFQPPKRGGGNRRGGFGGGGGGFGGGFGGII